METDLCSLAGRRKEVVVTDPHTGWEEEEGEEGEVSDDLIQITADKVEVKKFKQKIIISSNLKLA